MLQNEPLLDHTLGKRIRQGKDILGRTRRVSVVTNGALLTPDRINELVDAGAEVFEVSIDAYREETYNSIRKGLDFHTVVENTMALIRHPRRPRVTVRFLRQRANESEVKDFVRYWKRHGAKVRLMRPSNRAGQLPRFDEIGGSGPMSLRVMVRAALGRLLPCCGYPFASLTILYDGRVILCCHDWGPRDVVGDLTRQSVSEVWNGEALNHYRHLLWSWRFADSPVCTDCSLPRNLAGSAD
jgi:radical SAM protein with 4Fe4S-binding SPASM domain